MTRCMARPMVALLILLGIATSAIAQHVTIAQNITGLRNLGDYAVRDAKRVTCTATIGAGTAALTVAGCTDQNGTAINNPFASTDIGKWLVLDEAGAALATAPIASIAVSVGGSYAAPVVNYPLVTVSDASGNGFFGYLTSSLASATVATGGTGCPNGVQSFTLSGGTLGVAAQVSGTVTGGVLGGALTVPVAGSYTPSIMLALAASNPLPSGTGTTATVTSNGTACATNPTITPTYTVSAVSLVTGGHNYTAPTPAIANNSGTTLGAVTLSAAATQPLATTISAVSDSTHITLNANATTALSGASVFVSWGTDNAAGIANWLDLTKQPGLMLYVPCESNFGTGIIGFGTTQQVTLSDSTASKIVGCNAGYQSGSAIVFGAPLTYGVFKGTHFLWDGWVLEDVTFDGNKVVANIGYFACAQQMQFRRPQFNNAAPYGTNVTIGDGISAGCNTSTGSVEAHNYSGLYNLQFDLPLYGIYLNATDTALHHSVAVGVSDSGFYVSSTASNTTLFHPHTWDGNQTQGYNLNADTHMFNPRADGVVVSHTLINGSGSAIYDSAIAGPPPIYGVLILANTNANKVTGFNGAGKLFPQNICVVTPPVGGTLSSFCHHNPGAGSGFDNNLPGPTNIVGYPDAANAQNVSIRAPNILAGTNNTQGGDLIFKGSAGTGSSQGGTIQFWTASNGSAGTQQNSPFLGWAINKNTLVGSSTVNFAAVVSGLFPHLTITSGGTSGGGLTASTVYSTTTSGVDAGFIAGKVHAGTVWTHGAVGSTELLGKFCGFGDDGSAGQYAGCMTVNANGTVSAGKVPGLLTFGTATSAGTMTDALLLDAKQHVLVGAGAVPTLGTCGTGSVNAASTDFAGTATSTGATSCQINFGTAFANAPFCVAADTTRAATLQVVPATGSVTVSGLTAADVFTWICIGQHGG